jgi:hypothetical protein
MRCSLLIFAIYYLQRRKALYCHKMSDYRWGLIGNWIYWTVLQLVTTHHISPSHADYCSQSRCLVAASNGGRSSASGFATILRQSSTLTPCFSRNSLQLQAPGLNWLPTSALNSRLASDRLSLSLALRPTVSRPVLFGVKHPSRTYDQNFLTVRRLRVCCCGALFLTTGRVCHLQLLLALTSVVIIGSESRGTCDHNLLFQIPGFPFRRLLQLAGLRRRYSTPQLHTGFPTATQNWFNIGIDRIENIASNSYCILACYTAVT